MDDLSWSPAQLLDEIDDDADASNDATFGTGAASSRLDLDFLQDNSEPSRNHSSMPFARGDHKSEVDALDSTSSLTIWLAEHDFAEYWAGLYKVGVKSLRDLMALKLSETVLVQIGIVTLPSRVRFRSEVKELMQIHQVNEWAPDALVGSGDSWAPAPQVQPYAAAEVAKTDWFWEQKPASSAGGGTSGGFLGSLW